MKLQAVLLTLVMICLLFSGCTASGGDASLKQFVMDDIVCGDGVPMEESLEEIDSGLSTAEAEMSDSASAYSSTPDEPLSIQMSCAEETVYANDGSSIFFNHIETPVFFAGCCEDVETRVNDQITTFLQKREADAALWAKEAQTYYEETPSEDALPFYGWSSNTTVSIKRLDQNYISIVFFDSAYLGGAHPSNSMSALNFDSTTGTLLPLSAIFNGDNKDNVLDLLLSRLKKMEQSFGFCPDYESYVTDAFNSMSADMGQNWYLTDRSIVFFFSPGQISPYAAGVISVDLNYETLKDFLRSDFALPDLQKYGLVPSIYNYAASGDYSPSPYEELDPSSDINIVADLSGEEDAQLIVCADQGDIYDFRVYKGLVTNSERIAENTLYATNVLPEGSAVLLGSASDDDSSAYVVEYRITSSNADMLWVKK